MQSWKTTWLSIPKDAVDGSLNDNVRFQFVSFENDRIFRGEDSGELLNMPVISASVSDLIVKNLKNPVRYTIPFQDSGEMEPKCVFWNVEGMYQDTKNER